MREHAVTLAPVLLLGIGAGYGTAKAAIPIFQVGITRPDLTIRLLIPVLMAGVIGIFGLIVSLILSFGRTSFPIYVIMLLLTPWPCCALVSQSNFSLFLGSLYLGAGLCLGLCGLSAGICIGIIADAGIRAYAQQPKLFTILVLMLIFAEVLTIYGFVISLLIVFRGSNQQC